MYNCFKNCENISSLLLDIDRTSNVMSFVLYFVSNHAYTRFFTPAHTPLPSLQMTSQLCRRSHQSVLQKYIYFLRTNIQSLLLKYISFLKTNTQSVLQKYISFLRKVCTQSLLLKYVSFLRTNSELVLQK